MNLAGLVAALLPVFFVLALGYVAGKRNAFDADQSAGLRKQIAKALLQIE
jgi:malonate transporter and related proteins